MVDQSDEPPHPAVPLTRARVLGQASAAIAATSIDAQSVRTAELERELATARDAAPEEAATAADLQALASLDTKYRDACWASSRRIRALKAKRGEDG